jgi:hypothetical protein
MHPVRTSTRDFACPCGNLLNLQSLRCLVGTQDQYTDGFSIQHDVEAGRKVRGLQGAAYGSPLPRWLLKVHAPPTTRSALTTK